MEPFERGQFGELLAGILQVYEKSYNTVVLNIWWEVLKKYDLVAVESAFFQHLESPDTGQYAPKPGDVVRYIDGSTEDRALKAWALVRRSINEIGAHSSVVFPDPLIHVVITEMGGWPSLCGVSMDEMPFKGREFENRYRSCLRHPPTGYPRLLFGLSSLQNLSGKHKPDPPLLAGAREQCTLVYSGGYSERPPEGGLICLKSLNQQIALISSKPVKERELTP